VFFRRDLFGLTFSKSRSFFKSPTEVKAECSINSSKSGKNRGWLGMYGETLDPGNQKVVATPCQPNRRSICYSSFAELCADFVVLCLQVLQIYRDHRRLQVAKTNSATPQRGDFKE